jgi:hypothetical protein
MTDHRTFIERIESRLLLSGTLAGADLPHTGDGTSQPPAPQPPALNVLPRPSDLAATSPSAGHVHLTWQDNSSAETGFAVFRLAKGQFAQVGTVAADVTTFDDPAAPAGNDVYLVRALSDTGHSEGSNAAPVKVNAVVQDLPVLAPRVLKSRALSTTSVLLSWEKDFGATGGYVIERSADGKAGWTQVGTTPAGTRSFTDTGLTAKTRYYYRITAVGDAGKTAVSRTLIAQTKVHDNGESHPNKPGLNGGGDSHK